jgi:outer membrane protein OmpA-like peptidoglycan-associated protein
MKPFLNHAAFALLLIVMASPAPAEAQRMPFRGSQAHVGIGVGVFTYHGRRDLTQDRSSSNYTHASDPAAVVLGSFPIVRDRFFFRGMVGLSNLSRLGARGATSSNEFLQRELVFFEPQVVYTPLPGSRHRWLPYVYSGFGGLIANPFGAPNGTLADPTTVQNGPSRTVFSLPIGIGVDYKLGSRFRAFVDASYRVNFNYVGRNAGGRHPHNTSLILAGLRFNLRRLDRTVDEVPPLPLPEPLAFPPYEPPALPDEAPPDRCVIVEMNTLYFDPKETTLSPTSRQTLDENVEALRVNPLCCARVVGYTEGGNTHEEAYGIARERAGVVFDYYVSGGIEGDRLALRAAGAALPCQKKEDPTCSLNRRVESEMEPCSAFPGYREP